jgi:anti-sigma factor (TIGR02949 family)
MDCSEVRDLLHVYLDDELEADERRAIAAHLEQCSECTKAFAELQMLRHRIRAAGGYAIPSHLEQRLRTMIGLEAAPRPVWRRAALLAASHLLALLLGAVIASAILWRSEMQDIVVRDVLQAHIRALIADQMVQVASNETHEVKPWFLGKIPYTPVVRNLDVQGFPLIGGRVDYVLNRPAAAIVYGRRKHRINLFILPADQAFGPEAFTLTRDGFNMVVWRQGGFAFFAASDLNAAELQQFATLLQTPA